MGMFDTVVFECPSCGYRIEEQSKAGDCMLEVYRPDSVPMDVAASMFGETLRCDKCHKTFMVVPTHKFWCSVGLIPKD